jgi:FAD/FMN-containing dehydrogenase
MTLPADENAGNADLLAIYLNDHFAGATGGVELLKRAAQARGGAERDALVALGRQGVEDRDALAQVMADLEVPVDRPKAAVGWIAEKAGRLKPNGRVFSRSPLSNVLEAESALLGVQGKAACWRTLRTLSETDERLSTEWLDTLLERAEAQSLTLENIRLGAVTRTFRSLSTSTP